MITSFKLPFGCQTSVSFRTGLIYTYMTSGLFSTRIPTKKKDKEQTLPRDMIWLQQDFLPQSFTCEHTKPPNPFCPSRQTQQAAPEEPPGRTVRERHPKQPPHSFRSWPRLPSRPLLLSLPCAPSFLGVPLGQLRARRELRDVGPRLGNGDGGRSARGAAAAAC